MTDSKNAKLAMEYRPEIRALHEKVTTLPKQFERRFYSVLSSDPRIEANELETLILRGA